MVLQEIGGDPGGRRCCLPGENAGNGGMCARGETRPPRRNGSRGGSQDGPRRGRSDRDMVGPRRVGVPFCLVLGVGGAIVGTECHIGKCG
jgi:hypothetical protein